MSQQEEDRAAQEASSTGEHKMRDLTTSIHDAQVGDPVDDPVYQETRRNVIRFGHVFFITLAMVVFIPILIGVGQGISSKQVWDPYNGELVYSGDGVLSTAASDCVERAGRLLSEGAQLQALERSWAEPQREWQMRCRKEHPDLSQLLSRTRDRLRQKQAP